MGDRVARWLVLLTMLSLVWMAAVINALMAPLVGSTGGTGPSVAEGIVAGIFSSVLNAVFAWSVLILAILFVWIVLSLARGRATPLSWLLLLQLLREWLAQSC